MVARFLGVEEAAGSNPVVPTIEFKDSDPIYTVLEALRRNAEGFFDARARACLALACSFRGNYHLNVL